MPASLPSRRSRAAGALVLAALLASAAAAPLGMAKPASRGVAVQLRKMGGGPAKKAARGVRLVDGSTGEVLTAARVPAAGKTTLHPGAGSVAFAVASVARPGGTREGVSAIFRYEPGARAAKVKVPLAPVTAAGAAVSTAGVPRGAPIRTLVAARGSPVATMGDVTMSGADGSGSISGPLFTPLFNETSDTIIWVETGDTFTRARQGELDLQNQGPPTRRRTSTTTRSLPTWSSTARCSTTAATSRASCASSIRGPAR